LAKVATKNLASNSANAKFVAKLWQQNCEQIQALEKSQKSAKFGQKLANNVNFWPEIGKNSKFHQI